VPCLYSQSHKPINKNAKKKKTQKYEFKEEKPTIVEILSPPTEKHDKKVKFNKLLNV
jgi:hypothetical protein